MDDVKRIALIVRDRPGEALRVAGGLTLADDTIEVFLLDCKLDRSDPVVARPLELISELGLTVYSTDPDNGYPVISLEDMARKLLDYDIIVPY